MMFASRIPMALPEYVVRNSLPAQPSRKQVLFSGFLERVDITDPLNGEKKVVRHDTSFFRDPQLFKQLPALLTAQFPEGARIYSFACSDGSEAASAAMVLDYALGEKAAKYPILGRDFLPAIVRRAKQGAFALEKRDRQRFPVVAEAGVHIDRMFVSGDEGESLIDHLLNYLKIYFDQPSTFRLCPRLRERLSFDVGDMRVCAADANYWGEKPVTVFFRNAWYQMTASEHAQIVEDLMKNLPSKSLVVIGEVETNTKFRSTYRNIGPLFTQAGFQPMALMNPIEGQIFQKP